MRFYFDMDGTIVDLYGVPRWLEKLQASDPSPYIEAKPLINLSLLARYIHRLQAKGHEVHIITCLSKNSTSAYDQDVTRAKYVWLREHLPSVVFNSIIVLPYGTNKGEGIIDNGEKCMLFDDEENNRKQWRKAITNGLAYLPCSIFTMLQMEAA